MEFRTSFILILTTLSLSSVTSVTITVTPSSLKLTSGQNLTIRCQESVTGTGNSLLKLGLYKEVAVGTQTEFKSVVEYGVGLADREYTPTWGTAAGDLQGRLDITPTFTDTTFRSGSLDFVLSNVKCEDAAAFLCRSTPTNGAFADSINQNISIVGVTQLIDLFGAQVCDSFQDQETCDNCKDFDDPINGPKPFYARMNQVLVLTCTANVDSTVTTNAIRWYKKTKMDDFPNRILENITDNSNPPTAGSCTYSGRSTLNYYPSNNDRELRISCEAGSVAQSQTSESKSLSICVEGLTITGGPGSGNTDNTGTQTAGLGGGPIAGIVIGVIAVIVLVVVLVYFLWYRRRDGGESYSTREADGRAAPPPVSKKPEMHENSMYDTTGEPQQDNNYYKSNKYNNGQGKVNQSMDPDEYYHHDNDTAPRSRDPIGSSV